MVLLRWYDTDNSVPFQVTRLQRVKWATISGNRPHCDVVDASRIAFPVYLMPDPTTRPAVCQHPHCALPGLNGVCVPHM